VLPNAILLSSLLVLLTTVILRLSLAVVFVGSRAIFYPLLATSKHQLLS